MSKDKAISISLARQNAHNRFAIAFHDAKTPQELLQAYATYVGTLEGLLDTVEICEKEREHNEIKRNI